MAGEFAVGNRIVAIKEEAVAGTFLAPIAADYDIEFFDVGQIENDYGMNNLGKPARGDLLPAKSLSGLITGSWQGKTHLSSSGTASTAPKVGKVLKSAGLIESGGGTDAIVYTFSGIMPCKAYSICVSDINCGTAPVSVDKTGRGGVCNLSIIGAGVGQEVTLDCKFNFGYQAEADNATPIKTLLSLDTEYTKFLGSVFSLDGVAVIPMSFTLDLGNAVTPVIDPSKTGGILKYAITGVMPKLTMSIQKTSIATNGLAGKVIGDEVINPITISLSNWDLSITDANITSLKEGDGNGLVTSDIELEVRAFTLTQK